MQADSFELAPAPEAAPADAAPFGEPFDFSTPITATASKLDPSKFTSVKPMTGWSAKAGVDNAPATAATALPSELLLPNVPPAAKSGPAWANVTAPAFDMPWSWDKASIESRVDPLQDQSKLGVTFSRAVPIGSELSLTLQNSYSVTQTLPSAVGTVPTVTATASATTASRVLGIDQALKFNVLPSDTSFSVGATKSTADARWLPSFSAEQKLFGGPVNITGRLSQTTTGEVNKTLTGGFKQSW